MVKGLSDELPCLVYVSIRLGPAGRRLSSERNVVVADEDDISLGSRAAVTAWQGLSREVLFDMICDLV